MNKGNFDEALKFLSQFLEIVDATLVGINLPDTATCYKNIGSFIWITGNAIKLSKISSNPS